MPASLSLVISASRSCRSTVDLRGDDAQTVVTCQSASKSDPGSASKIDPLLLTGGDGSARPGGAGRGCAAGASAGWRGAVVWRSRRGKRQLSVQRADVARVNLGRSRGAERLPGVP